jgi:hypothetical protein
MPFALRLVYIAYAGIESQSFGGQHPVLFNNRIEAVAMIERLHVFNSAISL